jgi:hypothetical protein|tara:strand:+ start:413 stop:649 length:237 start_codon:yes stop_codon:yes gene_type:complete
VSFSVTRSHGPVKIALAELGCTIVTKIIVPMIKKKTQAEINLTKKVLGSCCFGTGDEDLDGMKSEYLQTNNSASQAMN